MRVGESTFSELGAILDADDVYELSSLVLLIILLIIHVAWKQKIVGNGTVKIIEISTCC